MSNSVDLIVYFGSLANDMHVLEYFMNYTKSGIYEVYDVVFVQLYYKKYFFCKYNQMNF